MLMILPARPRTQTPSNNISVREESTNGRNTTGQIRMRMQTHIHAHTIKNSCGSLPWGFPKQDQPHFADFLGSQVGPPKSFSDSCTASSDPFKSPKSWGLQALKKIWSQVISIAHRYMATGHRPLVHVIE